MRVIGGTLSGRRFGSPGGRGTRPTSDRVREALASALESRDAFHGARVLDLFAGTGALSFESLSRGADRAVVVDRDPRVLRELQASARSLGLADRIHAMRLDLLGDAKAVARKLPASDHDFDLVFTDAPYDDIEHVPALLAAFVEAGRLSPSAWVVVERPASHAWAWPKGLASKAEYRYGQTGISLGVLQPEKGK